MAIWTTSTKLWYCISSFLTASFLGVWYSRPFITDIIDVYTWGIDSDSADGFVNGILAFLFVLTLCSTIICYHSLPEEQVSIKVNDELSDEE